QHLRCGRVGHADRGAPQRQRKLGGQQLAGATAHAVGAEESAARHRFRLGTHEGPPRLALRELRPLARLLETGLAALLLARVAREEAAALQLQAQRRLRLHQRAGDAMTQRTGLGGDAAAVDARDYVHALVVAGRLERLARLALQPYAREVILERLAVDGVCAGAGLEDDPRHRGLA